MQYICKQRSCISYLKMWIRNQLVFRNLKLSGIKSNAITILPNKHLIFQAEGLNKREALNNRFVYPSKDKRLINQLERSPAVRASSKKRFI